MIQAVSDQMFHQFSAAMKAQLEQETSPEPQSDPAAPAALAAPAAPAVNAPAVNAPADNVLDVGALGASVGKVVLGRMLKKPAFWVVVAVVVVLSYLLIRR